MSQLPEPSVRLTDVQSELDQSLAVFKREYSKAVRLLYRTLPPQTVYGDMDQANSDPFTENVTDGLNENLFRIHHFCFGLEEWTEHLRSLVSSFAVISETEISVQRHNRELKIRWGPFANFWQPFSGLRVKASRSRPKLVQARRNPFPAIVDNAMTQAGTGHALGNLQKIKRRIWRASLILRRPDIRFAVKTGAGVALLASAAFTRFRPLWLAWRGEWALISYMVISAQSLGATNFLAIGRVLGTGVGGGTAALAYTLFPDNPFLLPLCGCIVSIPCFYVIVTRVSRDAFEITPGADSTVITQPQYGPSARFVLLTFNLTCLYSYNLREDTHVFSIAFHRSIVSIGVSGSFRLAHPADDLDDQAVAFGVVYGLIINSYIWPYEARRELRRGLSEYFVNTAHLYVAIVRSYSVPPVALVQAIEENPSSPEEANERTQLLTKHLSRVEEQYVAMELWLQSSLIKVSRRT